MNLLTRSRGGYPALPTNPDHTYRKRFTGGNFDILEARRFLNADGLIDDSSAIISPTWFEQITYYGPSQSTRVIQSFEDTVSQIEWQNTSVDVVSDEWIVQLNQKTAQRLQSVREASTALSRDIDFEIVGGLGINGQLLLRTFDAPGNAVSAWLSQQESVQSFEPNALMPVDQISNDPNLNSLWGINNTGQTGGTADADIDGPEAWDITTGDSDLVISVIDTGVDYTHPDLRANIWTNPGEIAGNGIDDDGNGFIDDVHGYDFVNNDGDPMDDNSHGTHVAGTIAAHGNNDNGITGVAWNASIMGLKFLDDTGSGSTADAIRAINYTTMMKSVYDINIVASNNSWGGGGYSSALETAISANADAEILFVAAAGNENQNNNALPSYPANYHLPNIISVASTTHRDQRSSFSNYGATSVDLAAPGSSILSTVPGGGYASFSGTSMATPHVTGVAALAWSVNPEATVAEVKSAILDGVDSVSALDGVVATGGRLNAFNTLQELGLNVIDASIAEAETLTSPVSNFTITLSRDYDAGSVDASDLIVNGIEANGATLVNSSTVTFHFNASPITNEGEQTLSLTAGAITSNGLSLNGWQRSFFFDSNRLQVAATTPSDGAVLQQTPTAIDFHFNEPIDTDSVAISDLEISQGSVTSASIIDDNSIRFGVNLPTTDTEVTYSISAGAIRDVHGSPSSRFAGTFEIDAPLFERFATTTPVSIVDNRVVFSRIVVSQDFDIVDLNVELDITHTYDADLHAHLISPGGTVVELFTNVGGQGDNFESTVFDDEANHTIRQGNAPFRGVFRPEGSLSDFDNESTLGTWTLRVADNYTYDDGAINSWGLTIEHAGGSVVSSDPAEGSTVDTPLTNFTLDFSAAVDATSVDVSDFTVNGTPADSVNLVNSTRVEFQYLTTPLTAVGAQRMALASDAVRLLGSSSTVDGWQANFQYAPYYGPVLDPLADQTIEASEKSLTVPFNATSPDGNPLTVSVIATSDVHAVQDQFEFYATPGMQQNDFYLNYRNAQEKYMRGNFGTGERAHFILPSGEIFRWTGTIASSQLVATVDSRYYDDLEQLLNLESIEYSVTGDSVTIQRAGPYVDSMQVEVVVSDGVTSTSEAFAVAVESNQVTLAAISDQQMSYRTDRLDVPISIHNPSGDPLTFSVDINGDNSHQSIVDRFSLQATEWQIANDYSFNYRGANERYLRGSVEGRIAAFFILPDGSLHQWAGHISSSPQVASIDPRFHADPSLLFQSNSISMDVVGSVSGSILTIDPAEGTTGRIQITLGVTNGTTSAQQVFHVDIINQAPVLDPMSDVSMNAQHDQLILPLTAEDPEGDSLTYRVEVNHLALELDQQHELYATDGQIENNYYVDFRGEGEKYLRGQANNRLSAYFILPDGSLHQWSRTIAQSPLVANLDPIYYNDPSLLYDAIPFNASISGDNLTLDPADGFQGHVQIDVTVTDGDQSATQTFAVTVEEPLVSQTASVAVDAAALDDYDSCVNHTFDLADEFASSIAGRFAFTPYDSQDADNTFLNHHGAKEKYFRGNDGASEFVFFMLPDGSLHRWRGTIARSPLVDAVDSCYYESLDRLFEISS